MFSNTLLFFIIKIVLFLSIIYFFHSSWNYLKDTYSTKKTKDLVNTQIEKYKKIAHEIAIGNKQLDDGGSQSNSGSPFLNEEEIQDMNNDLTAFTESLV